MADLTIECIDVGQGECRGPIEYRSPVTATGPSLPRCDGHWESRLVEKAAAERQSRRVARRSLVLPVAWASAIEETPSALLDFGLTPSLAGLLQRYGVADPTELGRLAALILEWPVGPSGRRAGPLPASIPPVLCDDLFAAFRTWTRPTVSLRAEAVDDTTSYHFSLQGADLALTSVAWTTSGTDLEIAISELSPEDWAASLAVRGSIETNDRVDPFEELWRLVGELQGNADSSWKAKLSDESFETLVRRFGLDGQPRSTLDALGAQRGVSRERIRQIEAKVVKRLRERDEPSERLARLVALVEDVACRLDCSSDDPLIVHQLELMYPQIMRPTLEWLKLLNSIQSPSWSRLERPPVPGIEKAVSEVLTRNSVADLDTLVDEVALILGIPRNEGLEARVRFCQASEIDDDGSYRLRGEDGAGAFDKRAHRLNAIVRILERDGPTHFTDVATRLAEEVGEDLALAPRNVHAWLDRNKDLFAWAGPGTFRVRSANERAESEHLPKKYAPRRRRGVGDDIVRLLLESQPRSLSEVENFILASFVVNRSSIEATIVSDAAKRFLLTEDDLVFLRDADVAAFEADRPRAPGVDWYDLSADLRQVLMGSPEPEPPVEVAAERETESSGYPKFRKDGEVIRVGSRRWCNRAAAYEVGAKTGPRWEARRQELFAEYGIDQKGTD